MEEEKERKIEYIVTPVTTEEVEKQADYGTFTITKTRGSIVFTNYTGYTVITKPYTVTPEGKAGELSLYAWLNYAIDISDELSQKKSEPYEDTGLTNGEWLEVVKMTTEANVTRPCVVFTDIDYAMQAANSHIEWLADMSKKLLDAFTTPPPEEDEKANAEEFGQRLAAENLAEVMEENQN